MIYFAIFSTAKVMNRSVFAGYYLYFAKAPKVGFMQVQKPESANKAYGYSRDSGSSRQPAKEAVK